MSALQQWYAELAAGQRTTNQWDALFFAAQQEVADDEFERTIRVPQREYLKQLAQRGKKKRAKRPAKWERDAARMAGAHDGA